MALQAAVVRGDGRVDGRKTQEVTDETLGRMGGVQDWGSPTVQSLMIWSGDLKKFKSFIEELKLPTAQHQF